MLGDCLGRCIAVFLLSTPSSSPGGVARFSEFELDLENGELRRNGAPLKLQPQPARLLAVLVSRAGEVVTRNELAETVWGSETFVDFEHGLNFAIRQIRTTLGDDAERPRFLETVPKRGYRFIAPVEQSSPPGTAARPGWRSWILVVAVLSGLLLAAMAGYRFWPAATKPHTAVLVVLPFEDLSPQPEEYLVEGLTEEMIAQLTRISPDLRVIARTSAMQYLHTNKSARQIAQELGADYILENSIRHDGERLRITAQLVRTPDQTHLWAENYDREMRDLLPLESEVTQDIAQQIRLQLASPTTAAPTAETTARPVDPEAHRLYLEGRYYFNQRSRDGLAKSVQSFSQAVAKDPDYAAAYAGLADAYNLTAFYGFDPSLQVVSQAKISALKALQLDDSLGPAHAALGYTEFMWRGDWNAAEREFRHALQLDDNYVPAHQWYALYLAGDGRVNEALGQMRYAQKLDPLSPSVHTGLAYMSYFAHDYEQATAQARVALQLNPDFMAAHAVLGWANIEQKKYPEAISELQTATKLSGGAPVYLCGLGRAYALSGDVPAAQKILAQVDASTTEPQGSGAALAAFYLALGDTTTALHWLEITAPGDIQINWLRVEPAFDPLRSDPRFAAIQSRILTKKPE